jgi:hypothetical protein
VSHFLGARGSLTNSENGSVRSLGMSRARWQVPNPLQEGRFRDGLQSSRIHFSSKRSTFSSRYFARFRWGQEKYAFWGGGNGGEAMTWHNEFTESIQADWVESVYTICLQQTVGGGHFLLGL